MSLWWSKDQLDDFGQRVRGVLEPELAKRGADKLVGNIVQSGNNINPVVTLETKHGTRSFQVDFAPENIHGSDEELRAVISRELDRIL